MADLPTNLKDDILDSSVNTRRKYRMIENEDGTYSFEDVTEYSQVGDEYGAGLINETNRQVNARVEKAVVVRDLETIGAITQPGFVPDALALKDVNDSLTADNSQAFQFAYDSATQKYGYKVKEADTDVFVPFNKGGFTYLGKFTGNTSATSKVTIPQTSGVSTYLVEVSNVGSDGNYTFTNCDAELIVGKRGNAIVATYILTNIIGDIVCTSKNSSATYALNAHVFY